ncbi:hypothetical protein BGW41_000295 [Actinomortierella wolfii]|nr:hypothetical protein BGW41_000295 [Actinomortierella wolfii]
MPSNHEDGIDDTTYSDDITNGSESHAEPTSVDIMDINSNSECSTRKPNTTITNNKNNHDNNDNSSSSNSIDDNEGDNDSDMGPIRNKTIAATIDSSITCDKDLQSRALLIHLTVYDSNGEELKSFFRCSNCPDKHFKVRQTARRHVRSHYSASKEMIECLGCGMRFARLDSCKRHIATPRNIQCHANQATGYYSIHDRIKGTCLRFKYPITSFFTANNRKDDLPADHAEQLAIVEQRNREIAAKYKKRRSGYRPRGITQVVTDVPDDEEVKDEEVETTAE